MAADPNLIDYLAGAVTSARRLKNTRIYPDTFRYWNGLLDEARKALRSGRASYHLERLIKNLEAELSEHALS
jgi:hypothetical protein